MFHNILVLVRRIKKVAESNRKYERVTVKTEKAEYGHVLTHAPSQQIHEIHNSLGAYSKPVLLPRAASTYYPVSVVRSVLK